MDNNIVLEKSKVFALRIIKLYQYLTEEKREYVLSKQLLRSGTSVGANARESKRGQSRPDFYSKLNIALKEADESAYWLELLHESNYIDNKQFESIYSDCDEIVNDCFYYKNSKRRKTKWTKIIPNTEFRIPNC